MEQNTSEVLVTDDPWIGIYCTHWRVQT